MTDSLHGIWQARLMDGTCHQMELPGTLDENRIGYRDTGNKQWHPDGELGNSDGAFDPAAPIATRFTRKFTYEGAVYLSRRIAVRVPEGKRVFLEAERARCLELFVDGRRIPDFTEPSISTPHIFEITDCLTGDNELTLVSDNSYPGLPHDEIVYSSAATDETQTNWNGVVGRLCLRTENSVFCQAVSVYPEGRTLTVKVEISAAEPYKGEISLHSDALKSPAVRKVSVEKGITTVLFERLSAAEDVKLWDEYEGNLYEMTARLGGDEEKTVTFGIRDFGDDGNGRLALNGRTIFLRSEANCAVFPETGYPPVTVEEWLDILEVYRSYGINCVRFHSHCPPEAAFAAADRMGMMMQPELSHWNPENAFESEESFHYFRQELRQVVKYLANHPSFVMLSFGNELHSGELGHERMRQLLKEVREQDPTRLYAEGSNVHYGNCEPEADSGFYTTQSYFGEALRGTSASCDAENPRLPGYINNEYPNAGTNYGRSMEKIRAVYGGPVFSFEVGQYEVLPDFDELKEFCGVTDPANLRLVQERAEKLGLSRSWKRYVEATGELARIAYREEIEAAMRTEALSGISLLGLQDFPGQGTALVGMVNSHLQPKPFPFGKPEAFRVFFRDRLPLVMLPKYTYETWEVLTADVVMANYGKGDVTAPAEYELTGTDEVISGLLPPVVCLQGRNTVAGTLRIPLETIKKPSRLDLTVRIGDCANTYPVWVYPPVTPVCPASVYETKTFDQKAREVLLAGGRVYLTPPSARENLPASIQTQFTTDFWSVGTFPAQEGGMGQLIDTDHPVFDDFPTEFHTNWQWWPMAVQRAMILPKPFKAVVTEMDSYAYMRPMAQLLECRCGNGVLMISSMGLQDLQQYPEARALLSSLYRYMESEAFRPDQEMTFDVVGALVR